MYREFSPSPSLAPYIECFWESSGQAGERRILPDGCCDILLNRRTGEVEVVGLMTTAHMAVLTPEDKLWGIRFHPAMASAFLHGAAELTDRNEPLASLWGREPAHTFAERLMSVQTPAERASVANAVLDSHDPRYEVPLAAFSDRHRRRLIADRSGVSPKALARILRFRGASEAIRKERQPPQWAGFALLHGYYDQAHFIHEFREFSGLTPGQFFQSIRPALR